MGKQNTTLLKIGLLASKVLVRIFLIMKMEVVKTPMAVMIVMAKWKS